MADALEQLAASIHAILTAAPSPMTASQIAETIRGEGRAVTRRAVNTALFVHLGGNGSVAQDGNHLWKATGTLRAAVAGGGAAAPGVNAVSPQDRRAARSIIRSLRSGTSSCGAAKAISVGTADIEQRLRSKADALAQNTVKEEAIVIAADWGFGKSHLRSLLSDYLADRAIPFVYECVDARAASLAHLHRSVPRWLEGVRVGRAIGLRNAIQNDCFPAGKPHRWSAQNHSGFAYGLRWALAGHEYGWLHAFGHGFRSPDYPYQHPKAWAVLESAATFLNRMGRGGLVLLLDEAENIDKQYDVRGRRKSYDTLGRMMKHPCILPVLFVTDRLLHQVAADFAHGQQHGWAHWTTESKWFVTRFCEIQPIRPPVLTDKLAQQLALRIASLHSLAYHSTPHPGCQDILARWKLMPTRSVRLLVRLLINEMDLALQISEHWSVA